MDRKTFSYRNRQNTALQTSTAQKSANITFTTIPKPWQKDLSSNKKKSPLEVIQKKILSSKSEHHTHYNFHSIEIHKFNFATLSKPFPLIF